MQRCKAVCKAVVGRHCYAVPIEMVVRGAGRELLPFIFTEVVTPLAVDFCENRHYIYDFRSFGDNQSSSRYEVRVKRCIVANNRI